MLFSNEIVFAGHPDKVCDQIGDKILDEMLLQDPDTRAGIEVVGGKGVIFITGEVSTKANINIDNIVCGVLKDVGYQPNDYNIINNISQQSLDIALGVDAGGAGDQGMMFGFACQDTDRFIPTAMAILQDISVAYFELTQKYPQIYKPDGKALLTGVYDGLKLIKIDSVLVSYQVCEADRVKYKTDNVIQDLVQKAVKRYGYNDDIHVLINPTGRFEKGGFEADAGVLGRKIVVDSYHGFAKNGGGAQSGKDATKVDRSAMYKARQLAVRYLQEYNLEWCEVQLSYGIGLAEPLGIYIYSNKGELPIDLSLYDECKPQKIIADLQLKEPIFYTTARFGHIGRNFPWDRAYNKY